MFFVDHYEGSVRLTNVTVITEADRDRDLSRSKAIFNLNYARIRNFLVAGTVNTYGSIIAGIIDRLHARESVSDWYNNCQNEIMAERWSKYRVEAGKLGILVFITERLRKSENYS